MCSAVSRVIFRYFRAAAKLNLWVLLLVASATTDRAIFRAVTALSWFIANMVPLTYRIRTVVVFIVILSNKPSACFAGGKDSGVIQFSIAPEDFCADWTFVFAVGQDMLFAFAFTNY